MRLLRLFSFINLCYLSSFFVFGILLYKIFKIESNDYMFRFLGLIFACFLVYWLTFFLNDKIKINIHFMGGVFVFSILIAEYFIEVSQIFVPKNLDLMREEGQKKLKVPFDSRSKLQVIEDYRQQHILAYPAIFPHNEFLDKPFFVDGKLTFPLAGISKTHTVLCNENGYFAEYLSDRYGFNNPESLYNHPIDIVLLGDSMIHGSCVRPKENLRQKLENKGNGTILNLGMGSNGPLLELAILVEYVSELKPKKVLWLFSEANDLTDLSDELKIDILANYLKPHFSQSLARKQKMVDEALKEYIERNFLQKKNTVQEAFWAPSLKSSLLLRHLRYRLGWYNPISHQPYAEFEQVLKIAKTLVKSWGGEFILLYSPMYRSDPAKKDPALELIEQRVLDIAQSLDIPVLNLKAQFDEENDPLQYFPFRLPGHFTPQGYELLANYITEYFKS